MASLSDALAVLNDLKKAGVLDEYAIGGAMAMMFWAEPTVTYDLDVFVWLPGEDAPIVSLSPLYDALRAKGFSESAEHVVVHSVPVQFIVSPGELADEAIKDAVDRTLHGVSFRVMRPEHLAALWLQAGGAKRRERVELLLQSGSLDETRLGEVLSRHGIKRG